MAKERKNDFNRCRGEMRSIIGEVARQKLSHDKMLAMRDSRVFALDSYKRLTVAHKCEINAMVSNATDAWLACGAIVWTHEIDGKIVVSPGSYNVHLIDVTKSHHRWLDGLNVWYERKESAE